LSFSIWNRGRKGARGKPSLLKPSPSDLRPTRRHRPPVVDRRPADALA
jgi:hypothetical protein